MKIIGLVFLLCILFVFLASAFTTVEITKPTEFSYQESLTVNVSASINISGFPFLISTGFVLSDDATSTNFNISRHIIGFNILNHSGSSTDAYGILLTTSDLTINATNDTSSPPNIFDFLANLTSERHWIKINFTNVSRADDGTFGGALTAERIVQVDSRGNILNVGGFDTINLSLDTGDISIGGGFISATADDPTCTVGEIRGNATDNSICLCTTTDNWKCATVS